MDEIRIPIACSNGSLQAAPRNVPFGLHTLRWTPVPKANVTDITFDDPRAPFTKPQKQGDGTWTSEDDNRNNSGKPEVWSYTLHGSCSPTGRPEAVDPEIINEPKGGLGDGETDEPGGGG